MRLKDALLPRLPANQTFASDIEVVAAAYAQLEKVTPILRRPSDYAWALDEIEHALRGLARDAHAELAKLPPSAGGGRERPFFACLELLIRVLSGLRRQRALLRTVIGVCVITEHARRA